MRISAHTWVEKWCMTAMEMQASKEAVRKGSVRASDTNTWKPLSAQIWISALLRSQPTWKDTKHRHDSNKIFHHILFDDFSIGDFSIYQNSLKHEGHFHHIPNENEACVKLLGLDSEHRVWRKCRSLVLPRPYSGWDRESSQGCRLKPECAERTVWVFSSPEPCSSHS